MKVLDVNTLQTGIDVTINDITSFCEHISAVQRAVRDFSALDDALRGKGGEAIRAFYEECHQPFLIFLHQSLIDYQFQLKDIKSAIQTFEPDEQGFIDEAFLMNDVQQGFTKVERKTIELTDEANSILASVQDIVTVNKITESDVMDGVRRGKLRAQEIVEQLHLLDDYGATLLEQTRDALQTMRTYLSDIESKFQSGDLSVTNFNSDALQDIASYNSIMDSIYNKETADIELNADTIEGMSLDDIEKAKNKTLEGLSDEGKSILKFAFNDLKNGHITKQEYLNILKGLQKIDNISDLENTEEELNITFIEYFIDNYKNIGINLWSDVMVALVKEWGKVSGEIGIVFNELGASIRDIGRAINKFGFKLTNKIHSFFNTVGKSLNTVGKGFSRFGKFIHGVGQAAGIGTMAAGFLIGMDDDLSNKGKTGGEAFLHNATSLGVGLITNHAGTLATRLAVPFLLGSNPGGWAVLGGIALGTVVTTGFNYAYDINFLGIQDGLDAAGQALDRTYNRAKDAVSSVVDSAGEAIKGGLDAINPMNWGWG